MSIDFTSSPMEVSIIDPGALNPLYGNSSETAKGPWYILMEPLDGLVFTRDRKEHALRRKIVDQSLSSKALVTYEPVIAKCTEQLLQIIEGRSGNPINITEWLKRYSFEIMGHLIFGRPFNTISEEGGDTFLLDSIHSDTNMMGYLRHMPWIPALLIKTPLFRKKNTRFWTWLQTNFRQRTEKGSPNPDIFSLLLSAHGKGPKTRLDTYKLCGLGYSILLAGSDTTFSVATNVFFNLARDRALTHKLQQALDDVPDMSEHNLRKIDLLNAVIYETLRLYAPVAAGLNALPPRKAST
ncbi:cytochrome P450 [Aspergillus tubingensis]|uniref:Putative cytochrome P450 n=1 Tax=Aspergillus niger TaxID=5061 RepID=A0A100IP73_ASPNG|nr:cytochrome P450 [Aspergillus tubingensis]GAQ44834.1 putative cytochrome P450 [Aspergillus niger]GFN11776.1 cytochrome P450 [Aspergillus tubingensis]